jgi:23S rRNA (guanosine2251-2'-O)-methyltransferase
VKIKKPTDLDRKTVEEFRKSQKNPIIVVLDNVRSMHNVGSVFRSADAFLINGVWLCGYTPRPPHRDIHKTALGATETVSWRYFSAVKEAIKELRADGYEVYAVEQVENSILLNEFSFSADKKIAVIFGNEVTGVQGEVVQLCDGCIEIPQFGMKHSLNVSIAAAIVMWEMVRAEGRGQKAMQ